MIIISMTKNVFILHVLIDPFHKITNSSEVACKTSGSTPSGRQVISIGISSMILSSVGQVSEGWGWMVFGVEKSPVFFRAHMLMEEIPNNQLTVVLKPWE